jgi:penicillin amidase
LLELRNTIWGPVLQDPLLGSTLALHWTALDPAFVNLRLLDIDRADTLEQAVAVFNCSGIPPQNVVMADADGHIAWTYAGVFPKRRGFDGSTSESWADGHKRWDGAVPAEDLPRLIDPADGYIATANNRTLGRDYPYVIGHNYAHSYRAYRIAQRLAEMPRVSEGDMLALQLDTVSSFFEFYRQLVRELADEAHSAKDVELAEARRAVEAWDGRLDSESRGIALLIRFRKRLAQSVFAPWIRRCIDADPQFTYGWREMETPLRALLQQRSPQTLPAPGFETWEAFLRAELLAAIRELKAEYPHERLEDLAWRQVNVVHVRHPFGRLVSWLSPVLDMPAAGLAGCSGYCVRILSGDLGASERFVVSPGHHADGLFHMPGGQSGHPLSSHYRDEHQAWADGWALPFGITAVEDTLTLLPQ